MEHHPLIRIRNRFVRYRNLLLSEADFAPLVEAVDAHRAHFGLSWSGEHRTLFLNCLAAFTLHCASRPRNEHLAWTLSFQDPLVNVFLAGDTADGTVTGRIFTDNVKEEKFNSFYQERATRGKPVSRSFVEFQGRDPLLAAETYYERSEQRPSRFFQVSGTRYVMVGAHPDFDEVFFRGLDQAGLSSMEAGETINTLETRDYGWFCGCNDRKIFKVLEQWARENIEDLFLGEESISVNCPRCAAAYIVTREAMEAFLVDADSATTASE